MIAAVRKAGARCSRSSIPPAWSAWHDRHPGDVLGRGHSRTTQMAIGVINNKDHAVRLILAIGRARATY